MTQTPSTQTIPQVAVVGCNSLEWRCPIPKNRNPALGRQGLVSNHDGSSFGPEVASSKPGHLTSPKTRLSGGDRIKFLAALRILLSDSWSSLRVNSSKS